MSQSKILYNISILDVDFSKRLYLPKLFSFLLDASEKNATSNGFGMEYLQQRNRTWVLSRFSIELDYLPMLGEEIYIETWIEDANRMITTRNFAIMSASGETIGAASSVWAMLDLQTRKAVNFDADYVKFVTKRPALCQKPRRIGDLTPTLTKKYFPLYSDIDTNIHVYSGKYIEWFLNMIPSSQTFFARKIAKYIELNFVSESLLNDDLNLAMESVSDNECLFEVKRLETLICRMRIVFSDKKEE